MKGAQHDLRVEIDNEDEKEKKEFPQAIIEVDAICSPENTK